MPGPPPCSSLPASPRRAGRPHTTSHGRKGACRDVRTHTRGRLRAGNTLPLPPGSQPLLDLVMLCQLESQAPWALRRWEQ